jgi:hypothetical protein
VCSCKLLENPELLEKREMLVSPASSVKMEILVPMEILDTMTLPVKKVQLAGKDFLRATHIDLGSANAYFLHKFR